jgi:hypothetical protein
MRDLEEVLAEKALDDERFRDGVGEAIDLHGLLDHPGWKALKKHFENGKVGFGEELISRQMRGEEVSQREIDYMRGAKEMAETIFKYPTMALSRLERTAQSLMRKEFEHEMEQQSVASPYIDQEVQ